MEIKLRLTLEDELDNLKCDLEFYENQIEGAEKHVYGLKNTYREIKDKHDAIRTVMELYREEDTDVSSVDD